MKKEIIKTRDGLKDYLVRYPIVDTKWLKVYIHNFKSADEDFELHDHPYSAFSVILRGGYVEQFLSRSRVRDVGSFGFLSADTLHRIAHIFPNTWTLFIGGPRQKNWGFMVGKKWLPHQVHLSAKQHKRSA